jgi:hypothetical protein
MPSHESHTKPLVAALVAWLSLGIVLGVSGVERAATGVGWALAGILSALSFAALIWARRRSFQDLLAVIVGGFLARVVVVGVTLILLLRAHADPLHFALGFFSAYLLLQVIEVIWLNGQGRQAGRELRT